MTEKNAHFKWAKECDEAFQLLRGCLYSSPLLAYPDFSKHFTLDTDPILLQQDKEGREQVIAYGSHLTKSERRYLCYQARITGSHFFREALLIIRVWMKICLAFGPWLSAVALQLQGTRGTTHLVVGMITRL